MGREGEGSVEGQGEKRGTGRGTSSAWGSPHKGGHSKAALEVQQEPARGRSHGKKLLHVHSLKPFKCLVCWGNCVAWSLFQRSGESDGDGELTPGEPGCVY